MRNLLVVLAMAGWLAAEPEARAQARPYIGYAYPAGGQQGTTFQVRLGGQGLEGVSAAQVTGAGVTAKLVVYYRRINNQEVDLLNEQLRELKRAAPAGAAAMAPMMKAEALTTMSDLDPDDSPADAEMEEAPRTLIAKIEKRTREFVQTPASAAISTLAMVAVTIAPDAAPGEREIRLVTARGVSNPLPFHVGQVPELSRKPMVTARLQVLGKEAQALRKRPPAEVEDRVPVPCTVNGQIASGEVNRYRFPGRQGQRLVITTWGRRLVPYLADAVPGWFQPVLALYDAKGKELAYCDDFRFQPDPTLYYEVPWDGEYVFEIHDSLYRGREDFVYRITIGELPFVTGIFPLGGRAGEPPAITMKGWNLDEAALTPPAREAGPGVPWLTANRKGFISNRVPFALDILPEVLEREPNNDPAHAQPVTLPVILNGRVEKPDDADVYQFTGKMNDTVVAEVRARRLGSPLDSLLKLTDAQGAVLAFNDDHEDLASGLNTHQADSYLTARLPADGTYYVHLGDTARHGGEEYAYRLRLSAPQPDFALRVVPSSVSLRGKSAATLRVHVSRQDGFTGPIKLGLKDPPVGFSSAPVTLSGTQMVAQLSLKSDLVATEGPVTLSVVGRAQIGGTEVTRAAVPAEDRMQAFLWRHLVPAGELRVLVFDPTDRPAPKRPAPARPPSAVAAKAMAAASVTTATNAAGGTNAAAAGKPKFNKQQIAGRLRQLKLLYEEGLLTDSFYAKKVAECDAAP